MGSGTLIGHNFPIGPIPRIVGGSVVTHEQHGVRRPRSTEAFDIDRPRGGEDCGRVKTADLDEPVTGDALEGDVFLNFHKRILAEIKGKRELYFAFL